MKNEWCCRGEWTTDTDARKKQAASIRGSERQGRRRLFPTSPSNAGSHDRPALPHHSSQGTWHFLFFISFLQDVPQHRRMVGQTWPKKHCKQSPLGGRVGAARR